MDLTVWKLFQKRVYDLLSHRYGLLMILGGAIVITVSAFHFGETLLEWSHEKYASVFNSYSDNLAQRSFRERLCLPVPIDVVYTWVNGSDPHLVFQLHQVKMSMEEELNITRPGQCTFSNCVPAPVLVVEGLPYTDVHLQQVKQAFDINATWAFNYTALTAAGQAESLALVLSSWEQVKPFNGQQFKQGNLNYTLTQAFYTGDSTLPHATAMNDKVLMTGFPHEFSSESILRAIPEKHQKHISKVEVHQDKGVAVLHMSGTKEAESILQLTNITIEGKTPAFTLAYMVHDLTDLSRDGDVASSRFEDNEELRYSLRSLERFAPWIRHVYIVTNGHIPYWLNLDSPRITIITHEEIFPNQSHLPTFSSPAIESNLHRIPGLSDKFLYLNDDVMFGKEVWPDDFYTYATGQKLYLTWPVPSCNEGCPSNWIRDGYCDKACNTSQCEWDGGDCSGTHGQVQLGAGFQAVYNQQSQSIAEYCHAGCANNWLADKYCDQACNHLQCGFDLGDCGISSYDQLVSLDLKKNPEAGQHYTIPAGETLAFLNLTHVVGPSGKVTSAGHKVSPAVRAAAVANKFKVMTILLFPDRNATTLSFHLKGHGNGADDQFELNFTVSVDSSNKSIALRQAEKDRAANKTAENEEDFDIIVFEEYPQNILKPHVLPAVGKVSDIYESVVHFPFNISSNLTLLGLSPDLRTSLSQLMADKADGDYTDEGFEKSLKELYQRFQPEIAAWKSSRILGVVREKLSDTTNKLAAAAMHRKLLSAVEDDDTDNGAGKSPDSSVMVQLRLLDSVEDTPDENSARNSPENSGLVKMRLLDGVESHFDEHGARKSQENSKQGKMKLEDGSTQKSKAAATMNDEEFLRYLRTRGSHDDRLKGSGLPWETRGIFAELQTRQKELKQAKIYETDHRKGRQLLDTFGDSLRHVNRLYNKLFGFASRKVPAHMPHMIDKHIMAELQAIFPVEWEVTSSHKVRSPDDMQFAFSYYYYLLGAVIPVEMRSVFDEMDTDHSKILSDRELRTLATRINDLPLYLETLTQLENTMINCSQSLSPELSQKYGQQILSLPIEEYYDSKMPQVSKLLFVNCPRLADEVKEKFKPEPKYKTTLLDDSEVAFKMIQGNVSQVVGQLDDIRKNPKKFVCLNDNIDHGTEQARTVKAVVQDFYESLLPVPSQFELPREYRNRFLHMKDLREWKHYRDWLRFWAHVALVVLVMFTIASYFGDKLEALQRRLTRQRHRSELTTSSSSSDAGESSAPETNPPLLPV